METDTLEANYLKILHIMKKYESKRRVQLLAVSKKQEDWKILHLFHQFKHLTFGENYLTELKNKMKTLPTEINWTYLGLTQHHHWRTLRKMNLRLASVSSAEVFDWAEASPPNTRLTCLIQVALEPRPGRGGCSLDEASQLMKKFANHTHIQIKGILFMPLPETALLERRKQFREMRLFYESMRGLFRDSQQLDTLSQGMSEDYEVALEEGSTEIRLGTSLFGERNS